jgi:uncharacterized protein (TIGR02117 family)
MTEAAAGTARRGRGRRALRAAGLGLAGILALPLLYLLLALLLGLVPANPGWREPAEGEGVQLFIRTNGVHTWIVMPKVRPEMDWRPFAPPEHLRDPRYGAGDHVAIGYGNRTFYLETPTWGDLTVHNALAAAFGRGRSLLHVEHDHAPLANEWQRPLRVSSAEYARLARWIAARFELGPDGRVQPLIGRGYNDWDMFYEAHGGYSLVLTCNEWTGRALRQAGIGTGLWTPLEQSVMWRLD